MSGTAEGAERADRFGDDSVLARRTAALLPEAFTEVLDHFPDLLGEKRKSLPRATGLLGCCRGIRTRRQGRVFGRRVRQPFVAFARIGGRGRGHL